MNIALYVVCREIALPHAEKSALLALSGCADRNSFEASPSVATLAKYTGMGTTAVRNALRSLAGRNLITPQGNAKGGRHQSTLYLISPEAKPNAEALTLGHEYPTDSTPIPNGNPTDVCRKPNGRALTKVLGKKVVEGVATSSAVSEEQMEEELRVVWNYHLDARGRQENLSPSKKQMGLGIIRKVYEQGGKSAVIGMTTVIDMTHHLAKKNRRKDFLTEWFAMFSKWNTFVSLHQQYQETDGVTDAAELPAKYEVLAGGVTH